MRSLGVFLSALLTLSVPSPASTQTSATQSSPAQAVALLQQSLAALVGNMTLSDITLTGSVRRIAGSDDETGTATLQAVSNCSARLNFTFSSGTSSETSNLFAAPAGTWTGPDGLSHRAAPHNLLAETAWFSPALSIARRLSGSSFVANYIGPETRNGQAVVHVSVSQPVLPNILPVDPALAHLTQVDFFLDSTTLLPARLTFNIHPDDNELFDISVEIHFSDYRAVNGAQVPFHVQRFVNGSLFLDLQFQSVNLNTGLAASTFGVK